MVHKYLGRFKAAEQYYGLTLRHSHRVAGTERHELLANIYHNLGGLEYARHQFSRAERYARKSLRFRAKVAPANGIALAADRVALAAILDGLGKFDESRKLYRQSLVAYRRAYGKSHREIALVLNNLAALYHKTGQYVRAETHYRAALTMKRRELGKSHPDLAITMNNLAILLASVGNAKLARRFFQNAMKIFAMSLGNAHAHTLAVKKNLRRMQT